MKENISDKAMIRIPEQGMNQQEPEFIPQSNPTVGGLCRLMATKAILVIFAALVPVSLILWENRDKSQIDRVLSESSYLVKLAAIDQEGFDNIEAWTHTLVISGMSYRAIESARKIGDADLRSRVMAGIVVALGKLGKTDEALPVAVEAFESADKILDARYRTQAMVNIVEALAKVG